MRKNGHIKRGDEKIVAVHHTQLLIEWWFSINYD